MKNLKQELMTIELKDKIEEVDQEMIKTYKKWEDLGKIYDWLQSEKRKIEKDNS